MTFDPPPDMPTSMNRKNKISKNMIISVVAAILLTLAGLAVYTWAQNNNQAVNKTGTTQPQDEAAAINPDETKTLTTTLPNGRVAMYDNTEGNRNIIFLSSELGTEYIALSHKAIDEYISSADKAIVNELCGMDGELAEKDEVVVGVMSTIERIIQYPTKSNCLDELATMRNTDASSRAKAVELAELVKADVKQFYSTVIIK